MKPLNRSTEPGSSPTTAPIPPTSGGNLALPEPVFVGDPVPSVIHPQFRGVHLTAGFFGSGKTTIHLGTDRAENILFIDMEVKGRNLTEQVGLQNYFAPVEEAANVYGMRYEPRHLFQRVTQILSAIPNGRFTTVIIDGLTILQEGILEEVKSRPRDFGIDPGKAASGSMGGAWPGVNTTFQKYFNMMKAKGVQVIGITTELKSKWSAQGPMLNQYEVKGVSIINKYAICTGITLKGDAVNQGAPAGLISKEQLGKVEWVNGIMRVRKRLPLKLPLYSMSEIYRYLDHPVDWNNPSQREIPNDDETRPYSSFVGKDQIAMLQAYLEAVRAGAIKTEGDNPGED